VNEAQEKAALISEIETAETMLSSRGVIFESVEVDVDDSLCKLAKERLKLAKMVKDAVC
jgi:hypothetical protein